ncbi:hypothetical protein H0H92_016017 [Tricholoma furcatifolium]|nr:hypothetical protein H0H92_016017 [Tricholoma furcatifolium]
MPATRRFVIIDEGTIHDSNDENDPPPSRKRQRTDDDDEVSEPTSSQRKVKLRASLRPDYDGTEILIHDPHYYFGEDPEADCYIRVQKILFKVQGFYPLKLDREKLNFGHSEEDAEGQPRTLEDLERVLLLATVTKNFEFDRLHDWTIESMHRAFSSNASLIDSCSSAIFTRIIEVAVQYKARDLLDIAVSKWCDRIRRKESPAVPAILAADEHKIDKLAGVAYYTHLLEAIKEAPPATPANPLRIQADPKLSSRQLIQLLSGHLALVNFSEQYRRSPPKLERQEECSVEAHRACTVVWNERWQAARGSPKVLALCSADVLGLVAEMGDKLRNDKELDAEVLTEACKLAGLQSLKQNLAEVQEQLPRYFIGCIVPPSVR